jgi:uncharacterized protein involved in outer membrane biogenesis
MSRPLRISLFALAGLAFALVMGLLILAHTLDLAPYVRLATDRVNAATGRELAIGGPVKLRVFPSIAVVAENVSFSNAGWGSRPEMVKVKRLEGSVALLPLLRKEIEITRIVLIEPDVLLETDAKGVGNWVFKPQAPPAGQPAEPTSVDPAIDVTSIEIDDGRLLWRRGAREEAVPLTVSRLRVERRTLGDRLDVDLAAALRDQPFTLKGSIGTLRAMLGKEAAWPFVLTFATTGARLAADGLLDWRTAVPTFAGTVKGELAETTAINRLAGKTIALPVPFALDAKASATRGEFTVEPLKATIGKSVIEGKATVRTAGARPYVNLQLKSPAVDLAAFPPPQATGANAGGGRRDGRVFSDEAFPLDALRAFDADAELAIGRLVTPRKLAIEDLAARAALNAGKLEMHPVSARVGGGAVNGRLTLDASRAQSSTLAVQLDARGIDLERVAAAAGYGGSVQGGRLELAVNLTGPGSSIRRFAAGSSGQLRLVVSGPARLSGAALDLGGDVVTKIADTINPFRRTERASEIRCAVALLPIRSGVATVQRTIAIETNRVNAVAAGTIDLRTEALDLAIRPTVTEGIGVGAASLADLVRITGTLGNPGIGIDTLASARAALSVGGAVLTGGLSLLGEALLSRTTADRNPCQTALAGGQPSRGTQPPSGAQDRKQDENGFLGSVRRLFR